MVYGVRRVVERLIQHECHKSRNIQKKHIICFIVTLGPDCIRVVTTSVTKRFWPRWPPGGKHVFKMMS